MKLLSFRHSGRTSFGAVSGDGVVDLNAVMGGRFPDLRAVLEADALDTIKDALKAAKVSFPLSEIEFLPVIPNPPKIFCIGINYRTHMEETKFDLPPRPLVFSRFANSQVGHGQPMLLPPESTQFDYEGEIAVIIGKSGRRISRDDSWSHVAGYAPYNDGSIRDWQKHSAQWIPGKNFYATGGFGPWMATRGEIPDNADLTLVTRLNGMEVQRAKSSQMIFSIPELIEYCSTFTPLEPGDVIVSGTPGGVGARRDPQLFMKNGDIVEVEIEEIGVLQNRIVAEAL